MKYQLISLALGLLCTAATGVGHFYPENSGEWTTVKLSNGKPTRRHASCSLMVGGKVYLIGGRGMKPISVYDPQTGAWTNKGGTPIELNHMQCAAYQDRYVYIAGAFTGKYPRERAVDATYIYDTVSGAWSAEPGLGERARGGGAFAFYNGKGYLAMGNRGGHGKHAETLGEFDVYDPETKTWTELPPAPDKRDHAGGGIVGNRFCIAGGRDGGVEGFCKTTVDPVNCYNFETEEWEQRADLPIGRSSAAVGVTCEGHLMIAGGETGGKSGQAFARVDIYDVENDEFLAPSFLRVARHGSGLAIANCLCGNIYIPSGSGGPQGRPELTSMEVWHSSGSPTNQC